MSDHALSHDPTHLPPGLPEPLDDGACDHLGRGAFARLPAISLASTSGKSVNLATIADGHAGVVLFFYPRTGVPGQPTNLGFAGEEWETIPGARGCTPQSCGFRDRFPSFAERDIAVYGVSTNTTEHQREFKSRMGVPFDFLSDSDLLLTRALRLPTFEFPVESGGPTTLIRRMAIFGDARGIAKVWYPVFPPDRNAQLVWHWVERRASVRGPGLNIKVRPIGPGDLEWVRDELARNWGGPNICSLGVWHRADQLPGFIAEAIEGGARVGLLTHTPARRGEACEVMTLSARVEGSGVGSMLLAAAEGAASEAGCGRVHLTTTNDNLWAMGFYQQRGWSVAAVHRGAMDRARAVEPSIPLVGHHDIPLRDEIELEKILPDRP